jgi:hypothetical protein
MIVTRPIIGWVSCPVAETAVILSLQYSESPQDIHTGGRSLQTVWTPTQCPIARGRTDQAGKANIGPEARGRSELEQL